MSMRVAGVSLVVEGEEEFASALKRISADMKKNQQEMKKAEATYGKGSTETEALKEQNRLAQEQLRLQKERTEQLKKVRDAYIAEGGSDPNRLKALETEILKSETAEAKLQQTIRETTQALNEQQQAAETVSKLHERLGERFQQTGESLQKAGATFSQFGSAINQAMPDLIRYGKESLQSAMDLEDSMYKVATLLSKEEKERLGKYTEAVRAASDETGMAATEIADAMYQAISSGQSADKAVAFVTKAAKAAKAGLSDTETVVNGATSILNAWGASAGGLEHVLDVMMTAQNEGKVTLGEISSQIGGLTGLAPQLGISFEEVAASIAALTKMGLPADQAITGLRTVMSNVVKPTKQATDAAKELGIEFTAAALQSKGLGAFLADIQEKTGGDSELLGKLFGSVKSLNEVMALGSELGTSYYNSTLQAIAAGNGAMQEAFETRTSSRAEKMAISLNKLKNAGTGVAEALLPTVDVIAGMGTGLADMLNGMSADGQAALTKAVASITLLGTGFTKLGPVVTGVGKLATGLAKIVAMGPGLAAVIGVGGVLVAGVSLMTTYMDTAYKGADLLKASLSALDIQVDAASVAAITSSINEGIAAANSLKEITVSAQVKFEGISDAIDAALGENSQGGEKLTRGESKKIQKQLEDAVVPQINAAMATVESKKTEFYDLLGGTYDKRGRMNDTDKAAQAEELANLYTVEPGIAEKVVAAIQDAQSEVQTAREAYYKYLGGRYTTNEDGETVEADSDVSAEADKYCEDLYEKKLTAAVTKIIADEQAKVQAARDDYYEALGGKWTTDPETGEKTAADQDLMAEAERAVAPMKEAAGYMETALAGINTILQNVASGNRKMTQQEIDEVNALLEQLAGLQARIDAMNNEDIQLAQASLAITKRGLGTDEDYGRAIGYLEEQLRSAAADAQAQKDQALIERTKAMKAAGDSTEAQDAAEAAYQDALKAADAAWEAAARINALNMADIFSGMGKAKGLDADWLSGFIAMADVYGKLGKAGTHYEDMDPAALNSIIGSSWVQAWLKDGNFFGKDLSGMSVEELLGQNLNLDRLLESLRTALGQELEGATEGKEDELSGWATLLSAMFPEGVTADQISALGLDGIGGTLADAIRMSLLTSEGSTEDAVGNALWSQVGASITENTATAEAAAAAGASSVAAAMTGDASSGGSGLVGTFNSGMSAQFPAGIAAAQNYVDQLNAIYGGVTVPGVPGIPTVPGGLRGSTNPTPAVNLTNNNNYYVGPNNMSSDLGIRNTAQKLARYNDRANAGTGVIG